MEQGSHSLAGYEVDVEAGKCLLAALDSVSEDGAQILNETTVSQPRVANTAVAEAISFSGLSPGETLVALDDALKQVKPSSGPLIHGGPNPPTFRLQNNNDSRSVAENAGRNAGDFLKDVLFELSEGGFLCATNLTNSQVPSCFLKNAGYFKYCLELCVFAGSPDDITTLSNRGVSSQVKKEAAARIDQACLEKMNTLNNVVSRSQLKRMSTKILGLGKRVRAYKQLIAQIRYPGLEKDKSQFKRKCNTEPLIEREELDKLSKQNAPGTPEGNTSIRAFTASKKRSRDEATGSDSSKK